MTLSGDCLNAIHKRNRCAPGVVAHTAVAIDADLLRATVGVAVIFGLPHPAFSFCIPARLLTTVTFVLRRVAVWLHDFRGFPTCQLVAIPT